LNEGSSRGHAAFILTISQLDAEKKYISTTFTLLDLAGAERGEKVEKKTKAEKTKGGKDFMAGDPMQAMAFVQQMKMESGDETTRVEPGKKSKFGEVPANITGKVINGELSNIAIEVLKATEKHAAGKKYTPPYAMVTPPVKFVSRIFDGTAKLNTVITLSLSGGNGWETWFSLQYGSDLAKLKVPLKPKKPIAVDQCLKDAEKAAAFAKKEFEEKPKNKYYLYRKGKAQATAELVEKIKAVMEA
jgi:hypothetical protein